MIDEYWTWAFYGYHSDELSHGSKKKIVGRCDNCCQYRVLKYRDYRDLCTSCVRKGKKMPPFTKEHRRNMSIAQENRAPPTDETRLKMAKGQFDRPPRSYESRCRSSAGVQGIPYEDWTGFSERGEYCEKFDEACRERIREKYGRICFWCSKHESKETRKLSVHHIDMDKMQGCNGAAWKLVPLCRGCHAKAHGEPMKSRIEYVLKMYG